MPRSLKTWDQFKINFTIAYTDLQDTTSTARQTGYANNTESTMYQDTVEAIANLANATMADREVFSVLTATVSRLTIDLAVANAKLVEATAENVALTKQSASKRPNVTHTDASYAHYCWTHGITSSH